ncbi:hypothetical protein NPIL_296241 [Nephila pilipes]|uniref:Uncharacterized protein n=1 Tax=Nephila pilipes TaxID=299642 RepID=A0A8X6QPY3_NEPPI|nr:hypothetical protein NPIL_296241 [Nephila pilipes]
MPKMLIQPYCCFTIPIGSSELKIRMGFFPLHKIFHHGRKHSCKSVSFQKYQIMDSQVYYCPLFTPFPANHSCLAYITINGRKFGCPSQ